MILASGCSWTDQNFWSPDRQLPDSERGGWKMWPQIIAEEKGMKWKNVAKAGCDNKFIFDSIVDQVWDHQKIDLCIVAWTGWDRVKYLNKWKHPIGSYCQTIDKELLLANGGQPRMEPNEERSAADIDHFFDGFSLIEFVDHFEQEFYYIKKYAENVIDSTFRYMFLLSRILEQNNIDYLFFQGTPAFALELVVKEWNPKQMAKALTKNMYHQMLSKNKKIIGFPFMRVYNGQTIHHQNLPQISVLDLHPNAEGQQLMAKHISKWII
jgi:hypothetical protein